MRWGYLHTDCCFPTETLMIQDRNWQQSPAKLRGKNMKPREKNEDYHNYLGK